jgi:hypothetical protein
MQVDIYFLKKQEATRQKTNGQVSWNSFPTLLKILYNTWCWKQRICSITGIRGGNQIGKCSKTRKASF